MAAAGGEPSTVNVSDELFQNFYTEVRCFLCEFLCSYRVGRSFRAPAEAAGQPPRRAAFTGLADVTVS